MLTPLDIENKRFSKQMMNGYNVEEVDDFLDEVGADYSKKCKEVQEKEVNNAGSREKRDPVCSGGKPEECFSFPGTYAKMPL